MARVSAQANDSGAATGVEAWAGFSRELPEHRELLVSFLLHCADLCCPLAPPPVSRRIAESLSVEFARQAERERAEGLPVTVPVAKDENAKAKMELGFIDFGACRLWLLAARVTRELTCAARSCAPALHHARARRAGPRATLPVAHRVQPLGAWLGGRHLVPARSRLRVFAYSSQAWAELITTSDSETASSRRSG